MRDWPTYKLYAVVIAVCRVMKVEKQPIEKFNNWKLLYYYFIQLETLNAKENLWKNKKSLNELIEKSITGGMNNSLPSQTFWLTVTSYGNSVNWNKSYLKKDISTIYIFKLRLWLLAWVPNYRHLLFSKPGIMGHHLWLMEEISKDKWQHQSEILTRSNPKTVFEP